MHLFLGTYTRNSTARGIYSVRLDPATGALSAPILAAELPDPTWLTTTPDKRFLYAVAPTPHQAAAFSVDAATAALRPLAPPTSPSPLGGTAAAQPPSHLAVDATGRVLLAANYRDGYVSAIQIHSDGTLAPPTSIAHSGQLGPHPSRQDKPHPHSVTVSPDNRHVIVADLGLDQLITYRLDTSAATLTRVSAVASSPAAGPRHFKFSADARHAYCLNELDNTLAAYRYDAATGTLSPLQSVSTLPADCPPATRSSNTTAEIRLHPNTRFAYASNRGHDSLAVFGVDPASGQLSPAPLQLIPSGGKNPRNFALSPEGRWLVCGHQDTALVTVFSVDPATGQLTRTPHSAPVPSVVCVLFL